MKFFAFDRKAAQRGRLLRGMGGDGGALVAHLSIPLILARLPGKLSTFRCTARKTRSFSVTKRAGATWLHSFSDHAELDVARSSAKRNEFYWLLRRSNNQI